MALTAPEPVEQALGSEATAALGAWIEEIVLKNAVTKSDLQSLSTRLAIVERDVGKLEREVSALRREMNERFDRMNEQINARLDRMNEQINARFDKMGERFDQMYVRIGTMMKWVVATIGLFGTLITILLAVSQFMK